MAIALFSMAVAYVLYYSSLLMCLEPDYDIRRPQAFLFSNRLGILMYENSLVCICYFLFFPFIFIPLICNSQGSFLIFFLLSLKKFVIRKKKQRNPQKSENSFLFLPFLMFRIVFKFLNF